MGPTVTPTSPEQPAHPPLHPFLGHHLAAVPTISSLQATAVDTYASRAFAPRPMVTQRCIMNMGLDGRRLCLLISIITGRLLVSSGRFLVLMTE